MKVILHIGGKQNHGFFQAFKDLGVPYEVYELDKQQDGLAVQDVLDNITGARTVSIYNIICFSIFYWLILMLESVFMEFWF